MNQFSHTSELLSKEEELMKINQQLDQQRQALKQDYLNFKNKEESDSDDYNQQDDEENQEDQENQEEFNDLYQQSDSDQDQQFDQKQKQQSDKKLVKFEDKKQEILELELLVDEQSKIIRVQNIKLESLNQDLNQLSLQNKQKENVISEIEEKGKNLIDQTKRYNAQITQLNERQEQLRIKIQENQLKQKTTEKENLAITKEIEQSKKEYRKIDAEANKKDININRTIEQIQKQKLQQQQKKLNQNDKVSDLQENIDQLKKENVRIEQQINESLTALKKQLKLIDILKRQRIHIIAAKMFSFIESDFSKAVDAGAKIMKQQ